MSELKVSSDLIPVEFIDTKKHLKSVVNYLGSCGEFAWDHESRSKDYLKHPKKGALRRMDCLTDLISFSTSEHAFVIMTGDIMTRQTIPEQDVFEVIKPLMEDNTVLKDGWNASYDMHCQANYGVWVQHFHDIMVMAYLLDENRSISLKERCADVGMALEKFDFKLYWYNRAIRQGVIDKPKRKIKAWLSDEEFEELERRYWYYSADDSIATVLLASKYSQELESCGLWSYFQNIRNPAVRTTFMMERRGMRMDKKYLERISEECAKDMISAEARVYKTAGKHFLIGSSKQLSEVLYDDMGLPVYKTTKSKGAKSTDAETLGKLAQDGYPIAQAVLDFRRMCKLYSTYIGPDACLRNNYEWDHIHPSFNPCGTKTGRLSSSDPNGQNMPRSNEKSFYIRKAFVASPGYVLLGADYSQIELRIMAHNSQDPVMISEYSKDADLALAILENRPLKDADGNKLYHGSDLHQTTADACNSTRNEAKGINFGLLYGMGPNTLAASLTIAKWNYFVEEGLTQNWDPLCDPVTPDIASLYRNNFFEQYRGVKAYQESVGEIIKSYGYVKTRYGQVRRLPEIYSSDRAQQMAAIRQGVNTTIQGHVGELMIHNMNIIEGAVKTKRKDLQDARDCLRDCGFRLCSQIHDEVIGEAPAQYANQCKPALARIFQCPMECSKQYPFWGYRIPLVFEIAIGPNWDDIH